MNIYQKAKLKVNRLRYQKLIIASVIVGFLSALLSDGLKRLTEHYEPIFFNAVQQNWFYALLFPVFGLTIIYFLRHFLFKNKENKGIKEIFESIKNRHNELPVYKIPSHFINGLLTIVFGGSTGIEVSTVVASATIGSVTQKKDKTLNGLKTELICAGVAAGITALFNSPIAGILFSLEVIVRRISPAFVIATLTAVITAFGFNYLAHAEPLFEFPITTWNTYALPYFMVLGVIAGLNSVYMTKCVLFFKQKFAAFKTHSTKIISGASILSLAILLFPQLYGDGYHGVKDLILNSQHSTLTLGFALTLTGIIVLKPVVTSATLAAGGDGGVFGPSLFIGAFLGLFVATILNTLFHADVIPVNFMVTGMAAVLSASIHAPFTALFLVCGIAGNFILFIPILVACLISKLTAKLLFPFTVYSYSGK
jgi:CIC family chloride channel protein